MLEIGGNRRHFTSTAKTVNPALGSPLPPRGVASAEIQSSAHWLEHDPDWYQAEIVIRETLKGRSVVAIARCSASVRLHSSSHGRRLSAGDREMCFLWPLAILEASVTPWRSGSQFLLLNPQPLPTGARKLA